MIPIMHANMYPFDYSQSICFKNNLYLMGGNEINNSSDDINVFYTESQEFENIIKLDQIKCDSALYLDTPNS